MTKFLDFLVQNCVNALKEKFPDYSVLGGIPQDLISREVRLKFSIDDTDMYHVGIVVNTGQMLQYFRPPAFENEAKEIYKFIRENFNSWKERARREAAANTVNKNYLSKNNYKASMNEATKVKTEGGGKRRSRKARRGTRKGRGSARRTLRAGRR